MKNNIFNKINLIGVGLLLNLFINGCSDAEQFEQPDPRLVEIKAQKRAIRQELKTDIADCKMANPFLNIPEVPKDEYLKPPQYHNDDADIWRWNVNDSYILIEVVKTALNQYKLNITDANKREGKFCDLLRTTPPLEK